MSDTRSAVRIRVTGIVIEDDRILLINQDTDGMRSWSLPGGKVKAGETLEHALIREMREETGIEVEVGRLLYVCDHVATHVVHITFEARRVGGIMGAVESGKDTRPIRGAVRLRWRRVIHGSQGQHRSLSGATYRRRRSPQALAKTR